MAQLAARGIENFHPVSPLQYRVVDRSHFPPVRGQIAEAAARFALGVIARESIAFHEIFDAPLEMELQLVVQVSAEAAFRWRQAENASDLRPATAGPAHASFIPTLASRAATTSP